jgi:hypothetical protein
VQNLDAHLHERRCNEHSAMTAAGVLFGAHDGGGFVFGKSDELLHALEEVGFACTALVVDAALVVAILLAELSA